MSMIPNINSYTYYHFIFISHTYIYTYIYITIIFNSIPSIPNTHTCPLYTYNYIHFLHTLFIILYHNINQAYMTSIYSVITYISLYIYVHIVLFIIFIPIFKFITYLMLHKHIMNIALAY